MAIVLTIYYIMATPYKVFIHILCTYLLAVVVNFKEVSYAVAEIDDQVSISLRIDGQFFVPVWAVVTINDGTATGLCNNIYKVSLNTPKVHRYSCIL